MANNHEPVVDAGEFEQWLAGLRRTERAEVEGALERDPHLRGEVRLILADLPDPLRRGFLRRFQPAVKRAARPSVAVMEGLRGAAREAVRERRRTKGGPS